MAGFVLFRRTTNPHNACMPQSALFRWICNPTECNCGFAIRSASHLVQIAILRLGCVVY